MRLFVTTAAVLLLSTSCAAVGRSRILEQARADFPGCGEPEIIREVSWRYYTRVCGETVAYTLHVGGAITREDGVGTSSARPGGARDEATPPAAPVLSSH